MRSDLVRAGKRRNTHTHGGGVLPSVSMATDCRQRRGEIDTCSLTSAVKHEAPWAPLFIPTTGTFARLSTLFRHRSHRKRVGKIGRPQFCLCESVLWHQRPCAGRLNGGRKKETWSGPRRWRRGQETHTLVTPASQNETVFAAGSATFPLLELPLSGFVRLLKHREKLLVKFFKDK